MSSPSPKISDESDASPLTRIGIVVAKGLLVCFFTFHVVAIAVEAIPEESVLHRETRKRMEGYLAATGTEQYWNMFTGIPHFHRWHCEIEVEDENGRIHIFGPVLPGLKPYDPKCARSKYVLQRMMDRDKYSDYFDAYVENAKAEIEATQNIRVRTLMVRVRANRMQFLHEIRSTGRISFVDESKRGPYRWAP